VEYEEEKKDLCLGPGGKLKKPCKGCFYEMKDEEILLKEILQTLGTRKKFRKSCGVGGKSISTEVAIVQKSAASGTSKRPEKTSGGGAEETTNPKKKKRGLLGSACCLEAEMDDVRRQENQGSVAKELFLGGTYQIGKATVEKTRSRHSEITGGISSKQSSKKPLEDLVGGSCRRKEGAAG